MCPLSIDSSSKGPWQGAYQGWPSHHVTPLPTAARLPLAFGKPTISQAGPPGGLFKGNQRTTTAPLQPRAGPLPAMTLSVGLTLEPYHTVTYPLETGTARIRTSPTSQVLRSNPTLRHRHSSQSTAGWSRISTTHASTPVPSSWHIQYGT